MFSPEPVYFLSGVSKWCGLSDRERKVVFVREDIKKMFLANHCLQHSFLKKHFFKQS